MADMELGLSYWLPTTQLVVSTTERNRVVTEAAGSRVAPVTDVEVARSATADPDSRQTLRLHASFLESIDLKIDLDDRGFLTSINSEAGRDISPVLTLLGKAVGLVMPAIPGLRMLQGFVVREETATLEEQWETRYEKLAGLRDRLEQRIDTALDALTSADTAIGDVLKHGDVLQVLQDQLAAISEARRAWIAGHNEVVKADTWTFEPADLVRITTAGLPGTLKAPEIPPRMFHMADEYGVVLAIIDAQRGVRRGDAEATRVDEIALRASRPVSIAVYLEAGEDRWELDPGSVIHMDVVDTFSETEILSLDGSWFRTKSFELSYHPDMSLKSFGVKSASNASAVATSFGEVLDAAAAARKDLAERPSAAAERLERAKVQLDLLKTANEQEVLAATRSRAVELAVLEQQKKISAAGL